MNITIPASRPQAHTEGHAAASGCIGKRRALAFAERDSVACFLQEQRFGGQLGGPPVSCVADELEGEGGKGAAGFLHLGFGWQCAGGSFKVAGQAAG